MRAIYSSPVVLASLLVIYFTSCVYGQEDTSAIRKSRTDPGRLALVVSLKTAAAAGTLIGLNELWYKGHPRSSFHFFNDNSEWLQMDKMGHVYSAYQIGRIGHASLKWCRVSDKPSVWYGGSLGIMYLSIVEVLDGFSRDWGFSWGDFAANVAGSALFIGQQAGWGEQRIAMKFSYWPSRYAKYRPDLLGENHVQRIIKDYNGETFWLSGSMGAFMPPEKKFPRWICLSLGYSAEGLLGGRTNPTEYNATPLPGFERNRRFLLSADVDFTKIPVQSKVLKIVFFALNAVKIPFPALEVNSAGKLRAHPLYF